MNKCKYLYLTILLFIFVVVVFYFWNQHKNNSFCLNSSNINDIIECRLNNHLSYQDKYNMFYKQANNTALEQFAFGFKEAFDNCIGHKNECSIHDKSVYNNFFKRCAQSGSITCTSAVLLTDSPITNEKIIIFNNTVHKEQIQNACLPLFSFFNSLTDEQKKSFSSDVLNKCENAQKYYQKYPNQLQPLEKSFSGVD